jgi:hypothetical protein
MLVLDDIYLLILVYRLFLPIILAVGQGGRGRKTKEKKIFCTDENVEKASI